MSDSDVKILTTIVSVGGPFGKGGVFSKLWSTCWQCWSSIEKRNGGCAREG
jgi:hypothetical protein